MNVNRTSDGSDGYFYARLPETRFFTDRKVFTILRVGRGKNLARSFFDFYIGDHREREKFDSPSSVKFNLYDTYIHIDRFSQKRHSCRISGYVHPVAAKRRDFSRNREKVPLCLRTSLIFVILDIHKDEMYRFSWTSFEPM